MVENKEDDVCVDVDEGLVVLQGSETNFPNLKDINCFNFLL